MSARLTPRLRVTRCRHQHPTAHASIVSAGLFAFAFALLSGCGESISASSEPVSAQSSQPTAAGSAADARVRAATTTSMNPGQPRTAGVGGMGGMGGMGGVGGVGAPRARDTTKTMSPTKADAGTDGMQDAAEEDDAGVVANANEAMTAKPTPPRGEPFFATVELEEGTSKPQLGHGDLWPSCWSNDDILYTAAGDGLGFGILPNDVFVAAIEGSPDDANYRGSQLAAGDAVSSRWSGANYNRKPTGMLCQNGDLYLAVQDLRTETFEDAPAATIVKSSDKGRTWTWDRAAPMFTDHVFTTIMFLDYGKDSEHAPSDYVYAYGLDENWAFSEFKPGPTQLFLARVPRASVQTRSSWEFFTGFAPSGEPRFSADIAERAPVLEDTRRFYAMPLDPELRFQNNTAINQGGVVYNAPLKRYLFTTWTEYTFELFEAPEPWGPFRLFHSKDFGVWPWNDKKNGGYGTTIPSKFISADGKDMLLQANAWPDITGKDSYRFSLRNLHVEPFAVSQPDNEPGAENLATSERGAVRVVRAARSGNSAVMNDGARDGEQEDSYNGDKKQEDFWGYTWTRAKRINTLRYTTGRQTAEGGFFEKLTVQARKGDTWEDVTIASVEPAYPGTVQTPELTTYTLRFDAIDSDGIRLFGKPGGTDHYTSIAELSVHFE